MEPSWGQKKALWIRRSGQVELGCARCPGPTTLAHPPGEGRGRNQLDFASQKQGDTLSAGRRVGQAAERRAPRAGLPGHREGHRAERRGSSGPGGCSGETGDPTGDRPFSHASFKPLIYLQQQLAYSQSNFFFLTVFHCLIRNVMFS